MISDFRFYLKLLIRRLPAMVLLFLVVAIAGAVIAFRLPTMYSTKATLLVESAQISDDLVRSTVQVDANEQLEVIRQRLLTRANLIDIANDVKIFPNAAEMSPDQIVNAMRRATTIRRSSGRDQATLMTISFEGGNPQKVAAVVNKYVSIVLETNSDFRAKSAEGTLAFFEQEVRTLSENLDLQSAKIVEFKAANADALPDNLDYRLSRQSLLQERVARAEREIEGLQAQRESIERVYAATGSLSGTAAQQGLTPEQQELRQLEAELRTGLSIYSETNPKIRNLRARIDALQIQIAATAPLGDVEEEDPTTPLDASLAEIDARIATLRRDAEETKAELELLNDSIGRTPANGIALEAMERDLSNIQSLYSDAVGRLSQARMSSRVETSGSGERITILEAASVPTEPSSPNRPAIVSMGIAAGLGLAAALFLLLEFVNQSIRRPADILRGLEITPLATIPQIETLAHRRWRRINQVAMLLIVVIGVPAVLWAVDTYYMPLDLLFEKIRNRLV